MSDYFDPIPTTIAAGTRALASQVNAVANSISAGFDKLPTETEFKLGLTRYAVDSGAADAYIVTLPYVPSLTDGFNFSFKASNANTGASTMNANSTGVKSIVNPDGSALIANTFSDDAIVIVAYESINDRYILVSQNPAQSALAQSSAIAAAASAAAASTSETNAATSETNAANSETNAATSETNAANSETAAAATLATFETQYLGSKASDPALDNVGGALIDGALYWDTTLDQMKVYNLGTLTWIAFGSILNADTLDGLDSTQFLRSDASNALTTAGTTADSLAITETTMTTGVLLDILSSNAGKVGTPVARVTQSAAGSSANAMDISNSGTGIALDISTSNGGDGLDITASDAGSRAGFFHSNNASRTVPLVEILNDAATGSGIALQVTQDQGAAAIDIDTTGSGAGIDIDVSGTGFGLRVDDASAGTGTELIYLNNNNASRTANMMFIEQDNASSSAANLRLQQDGPGGQALHIISDVATRTVPLVEIINDNPTGSGQAMVITNDSEGSALVINQTNAGIGAYALDVNATQAHGFQVIAAQSSAKGIRVETSSSTAGITADIQQSHASSTATALNVVHAGNGIALSVGAANSGAGAFFSNTGAGQALFARSQTNVNSVVAQFESNLSGRAAPILSIINNHPTGSSNAVQIQQDASGPHISLLGTNGTGIQFPATAVLSADVNTMDEYEEYTANNGNIQDASQSDGEGQTTVSNIDATKIGNVVTYTAFISVTNLGTLNTGDGVRIDLKLPWVPGQNSPLSVGFGISLNIAADQALTGYMLASSTRLELHLWDAATGTTAMSIAEFSVGGQVRIQGTFIV